MGSVPSDDSYTDCITSAVLDFSQKLPLKRHTTFNMVAGTASYALPDDFLSLIWLQTWDSDDNVIITVAGLVPLATSYAEQHYVEGTNLVFVPTPEYAWSNRGLQYSAKHILTGTPAPDTYALMTDTDVEIFMPLAVSLALGLQANKQAQEIPQHSNRAGSEDRTTVVDSLRSRARDNEKLYRDRVADAKRKRATMLRAEYTDAEQARMLASVT
jgi:hypothetical protein